MSLLKLDTHKGGINECDDYLQNCSNRELIRTHKDANSTHLAVVAFIVNKIMPKAL